MGLERQFQIQQLLQYARHIYICCIKTLMLLNLQHCVSFLTICDNMLYYVAVRCCFLYGRAFINSWYLGEAISQQIHNAKKFSINIEYLFITLWKNVTGNEHRQIKFKHHTYIQYTYNKQGQSEIKMRAYWSPVGGNIFLDSNWINAHGKYPMHIIFYPFKRDVPLWHRLKCPSTCSEPGGKLWRHRGDTAYRVECILYVWYDFHM